ncbi:MAG: hypothetical protein LBP88_08055 [Treponema sp.]|nr:hypothetical protein [Treponema sp.]
MSNKKALVLGVASVLFVLAAGVVFAGLATPPRAGTYHCQNTAARWVSIIIETHRDGPQVKTVSLVSKDYNQVITNRVYFGDSNTAWIPANGGGGGTYKYIDSNSFRFGSDVYAKR